MANTKLSDSDFMKMFTAKGPCAMARELGSSKSSIYARRVRLEKKYQRQIPAPDETIRGTRRAGKHPQRIELSVENGVVLVGSDAHYWPNTPVSTAHRAFIKLIKEMKPAAVVMNGDAMDFPQISRHARIGWEEHPELWQEIEFAQERLKEIEKAAPKGAELIWSLGNHDSRFETRLALVAPEFARLNGFHLKDYFPKWRPCWSTWINDEVVVKHRFKSGVHAPHNNTMWAGKTVVTGHLHSAKVIPFTDYNGTRYGVDTGCMANPDAQAFVDYTEDNPKNWRSAFGVFTFVGGKLLAPELVLVWDEEHVQFRGKIIAV